PTVLHCTPQSPTVNDAARRLALHPLHIGGEYRVPGGGAQWSAARPRTRTVQGPAGAQRRPDGLPRPAPGRSDGLVLPPRYVTDVAFAPVHHVLSERTAMATAHGSGLLTGARDRAEPDARRTCGQ